VYLVSDISRGAQPRNNSGISASIVEPGSHRRLVGSLPILPPFVRGIVSTRRSIVKYLPPFDLIRRGRGFNSKELRVTFRMTFIKIMRLMISHRSEPGWTEEHQDIAQAVTSGTVASAATLHGRRLFQGQPFPMPVDERWYLEHNADVAEACARAS
jgi:hypothetical protein